MTEIERIDKTKKILDEQGAVIEHALTQFKQQEGNQTIVLRIPLKFRDDVGSFLSGYTLWYDWRENYSYVKTIDFRMQQVSVLFFKKDNDAILDTNTAEAWLNGFENVDMDAVLRGLKNISLSQV